MAAADEFDCAFYGADPLDPPHRGFFAALAIGAEGKGLRKPVKGACDALARLPMPGPIGSLNASVAVAIALYEAVRQRGAP